MLLIQILFMTKRKIKEETHHSIISLTGNIASTSQEHQLIEDVLNVMMGIEGMYITVQLPAKQYDPPQFTVDTSVGKCQISQDASSFCMQLLILTSYLLGL